MSVKFSWPIFGHKQLQHFLQNAILKDDLAKTYLFYGPPGLGKKTVALYFAKSVFCENKEQVSCNQCKNCRMVQNNTLANLYTVGNTNEELSVEAIRYFLQSLSLSVVGDQHKIAVIFGADNINIQGANALLKTLEEPPRNTTIILVADSISNLPSTVISRCQLVKFQPLSKKDMELWLATYNLSDDERQTVINLSFGKPGLALQLMSDKLAEFKKNSEFVIKLLQADTFSFMQALDRWFGGLKAENPSFKIYELGDMTRRQLDMFELILRDILWSKFSRPIVNTLFRDKIEQLGARYSSEELLHNLLELSDIKKRLARNVSPQLLWENLLLQVNTKI